MKPREYLTVTEVRHLAQVLIDHFHWEVEKINAKRYDKLLVIPYISGAYQNEVQGAEVVSMFGSTNGLPETRVGGASIQQDYTISISPRGGSMWSGAVFHLADPECFRKATLRATEALWTYPDRKRLALPRSASIEWQLAHQIDAR